jgi:5'-methylthioadenosine phosphorylase
VKKLDPIQLAVIGGSGVYNIEALTDITEVKVKTPFGDPSDAIIIGTLNGVRMAFLPRHGRGHRILPTEVNSRANIFALKTLGVERALSISACGSLREDFKPRDIVVPDQLYDYTRLRSGHTFFGRGLVAHISFAHPFCADFSSQVAQAARSALPFRGQAVAPVVHEGATFITIEGPRFSTKAESATYRKLGFDIIGMTACPEAQLAREAELCYAVMAHVTDYDVWHETEEAVNVAMLIENLNANAALTKQAVGHLAGAVANARRMCECKDALATALITRHEVVPESVKRDLAPIIGKYLPAASTTRSARSHTSSRRRHK